MDELKKITAYCEQYTTPPFPLLTELERETHLKTLAPQMLTGHLQGQLLQWLSQLLRPEFILEVGTFTGYSAICLAQGLPPGGKLHTIEVNPELSHISLKYFAKADLNEQVELHIGDALEVIPTLGQRFDLVYLDAGKHDYIRYYELAMERTNPGGIILADNVLWSSKVVQRAQDKDARELDSFNHHVHQDDRVDNILLPVRDGIMVARKK